MQTRVARRFFAPANKYASEWLSKGFGTAKKPGRRIAAAPGAGQRVEDFQFPTFVGIMGAAGTRAPGLGRPERAGAE
jgi:hypothetical protein